MIDRVQSSGKLDAGL